jgi:Mn-dependent DtxR family transcriptional regulator
MEKKIGETAGSIWKLLGKTGEMPVSRVSKALKETDAVVYQGLGWLAREGKVRYRKKGKVTYVSIFE